MKLNKIADDVFSFNENNFQFGYDELGKLVEKAKKSTRKRARICIHNNNESTLHEMFIAKLNNTYVRPHKNLNKSKSFQLLEGEMDLVIFDNFGNIKDLIKMSSHGQDSVFFYRLTITCFHSLIIKTDYAIFKETITGPFNNSDTIYAEWAPLEDDKHKVKIYMNRIVKDINTFLKVSG